MGKYRGGPKPWEKDDPKGRQLDPGHYPELNAVFYTADPAEFIKMRIESLSLMAGCRFSPPVADADSPTCKFAEFSSKWRTGFSHLRGGS
ncbi:MAG: hypothetical protein QOH91_3946, partial [Mycobacterium sp.]|nr:hypothetical protein [Mycobacterium sp.]